MGSVVERAPQLVCDKGLLGTQHGARKAERGITGDDKFVLPELVVPPPSRDEAQCTVDLDKPSTAA